MLTPRDRLLLMFEEDHPKAGGLKDEKIRQTFGFSAVRYYQLLHALIDSQEAEAAFPQLVHRLRRLSLQRAEKRRDRAA